VTLLAGSLAVVVGGTLGTRADAATMSFQSSNGIGGTFSWIDQLTEGGPSGDQPLPGGFSIDNGDEPPPPPDYRAHSDVPDLPDGSDPQATSTGKGLYGAGNQPRLRDTFGDGFHDVTNRPQTTLPLDDGGSPTLPPAASTIPNPGAILLFGAAGLGAAGRRRRR
jgi:hypothetical protein